MLQIIGEWMTDSMGDKKAILETAVSQGVYIPVVDGKPKPMRFFSQEEAHDCVNGRKFFFAGDSE